MRLIDLGEDREKAVSRFSILHSLAFLGRAPASVAEGRRLSKIQDKIEEASEEVSVHEQGQDITARKLREGVHELVLDDAEVDLLKARAFSAEIPWLAAAIRRLTDTLDVLEAATEYKPELTKARTELLPDDGDASAAAPLEARSA